MNAGDRQSTRRARALLGTVPNPPPAVRAALELLRSLEAVRPRPLEADPYPALPLRIVGRLSPHAAVAECPLRCKGTTARECVARQLLSELELGRRRSKGRSAELKRHDRKRGTATTFPLCRTESCQVGAGVREALGDDPEALAMAKRAPRASDTAA